MILVLCSNVYIDVFVMILHYTKQVHRDGNKLCFAGLMRCVNTIVQNGLEIVMVAKYHGMAVLQSFKICCVWSTTLIFPLNTVFKQHKYLEQY